MIEKVTIGVFPVGGLGTRFLPATKSLPKEMLPVVDKPLIQYAYEEARDAGIEQFIFITGRNKNAINNHFDRAYELDQALLEKQDPEELLAQTTGWLPDAGNIAFIRQKEPLGLGHAIYCARHFIEQRPFAVLLADEMFLPGGTSPLKAMQEAYSHHGGNVIGLAKIDPSESTHYGIAMPEEERAPGQWKLAGMVEKPQPEAAPSNLSIVGRYLLQPDIFKELERTKAGRGNEIQLTDALHTMAKQTPTLGVEVHNPRFDCGNRRGFIEANIAFALERPDLKPHIQALLARYHQEP